VALVDASRRRIDDDEHLGREILAPAVENHARHVDRRGFGGMLLQVEAQCSKPVLAVDDQIPGGRLLEVPHRVAVGRAEAQRLGGEQQHRSGDRWLADRHLVEVAQRPHLGPGELALEGLVGALDARDELGDFVVLRNRMGRDFLALAIETADEPHLIKAVLRRIADEIEDSVLLPDARG
jgi:hypothetical protein